MKGSLLTAILVFLIACFLLWLCTGHENPEVYLFPSFISMALVALSALSLGRELMGFGTELKSVPLLRLLPALVIIVAYVMAVEYFGMYSSSLVALFLIALLYHPGENLVQRIANSALVSVGFIGVMYVLFSVLLKVQAPRGLFL